VLAASGREDAGNELIDLGIPSRDPQRSPLALAFGTAVLRNPPLALKLLASRGDLNDAALLLRDAFDMLEEDFAEERFFAAVRRAYWQAPEKSQVRSIADTLIQTLEF
jgi:hypothetical protein